MALQFKKGNKLYCVQDPKIIKSKDVSKVSNVAHGNQNLYILWHILTFYVISLGKTKP